MTYTIEQSVKLEVFETGCCGAYVAFTQAQRQALRNNHKRWYCPYGHSRVYKDETEEERAWRLLEEERRRNYDLIDRNDDLLVKVTDKNKEIRGLKKRGTAGTCLHCHRTFKQLVAHMKRKHPDEAVLEPVEQFEPER